MSYNAGGNGQPTSQALNIFGELPSGAFATETHNANDPTVFDQNEQQPGQYGSIFFTDFTGVATSLDYTGLQPINDTAPAVLYTFNDLADDQSFTAQDGPTVLGFNTVQFVNTPALLTPPTFETTNVANKTNIVFNTPTATFSGESGIIGVVNIPTPSTGLASIAFNTPTNSDNIVSFLATPPAVATSLGAGADEDVTNVTGLVVAAGTTLIVNGGAGSNTLNYDAGGGVPTVTPGLLPGEVLISVPGAGTVDARNYQQINIVDPAAPPPVVINATALSINSIENFQLVGALAGTFTFPVTTLLPNASPPLANLPASDFTATIDWGDGNTTAGTITQDANGTYDVTGDQAYAENGTYTVSLTITLSPGSITGIVNGTPVTITGPATTTGPTTSATATVTQGTLAVSAFPIVGTEGVAIASGPIATFIDAGGAEPVADYAATITIINSAGTTVVSVPAASITQNGSSAQYTVTGPALTLPEEGTYQVVVSVTDSGGAAPVTASGASVAVIADAPLTAGAPTLLTPNTGVALPAFTVVGTFTDANTVAPVTDFVATIDWGDGSPNSVGIVVTTATPDIFDVEAGHNYATPGVYTTSIVVKDVGGTTVIVTGSATVTDLPVTGSTGNFTAVEGQNTGQFVLATFTDPNTLATVADVNAQLAIGGWGDGTPTVAGINLVVQEIGVTPLTSATDPGEPIFEVLGSHTYAEETPAGLPDTLSVIITTLGGATTTLTSPPGGGVTVLDARLTSSNGTTITGTEGITTGTVLIGTFTDANQGATVADFTAGGGSVVVDWGDGSAPQTLAACGLDCRRLAQRRDLHYQGRAYVQRGGKLRAHHHGD